jgi:beta-glucosidase
MERIRAAVPGANVGIVLNFTPVTPIGSSPAALDRQRIINDHENRWYVDPIGGLGYPEYTVERLGWDQDEVRDGDMDLIARPIDMLGVNFYTRQMVGAINGEREDRGAETAMDGRSTRRRSVTCCAACTTRTSFPGTHHRERRGHARQRAVDGRVIDHDRLEYIAAHLAQVHQAMEDGVPVEGYFAWSLLDNFEWAFGLRPEVRPGRGRHGNPAPHSKKSALWYARGRPHRGDHPRPNPTSE